MAHERLKITGGVDTNRTPALNQASLSSSQCIRYMPDAGADSLLVQKVGGWAKYYPNPLSSYCRALWPWNDANDQSHLGVATDSQLAILTSGQLNDITPNTLTYSVPVKAEATAGSPTIKITDGGNYVFATTGSSGTGSTATLTFSGTYVFPVGASINVSGVTPTGYNGNYIVTASSAGSVSYTNATTGPQTVAGTVQNQSAVTSYDTVYIETPITVGGLTIFGLYPTTFLSNSTYTITARDEFGNAQNAVYSTGSFAVTGATGTGSTVTLTFAAGPTFPVGTQIVVSGINPAAYNGTFIVTASTATTVSYASTASAAYVSGGTITNYGALAQFTTTIGSPIVKVTFYNHGLLVGDPYTMLAPTTVNGLLLQGTYDVVSVIDNNSFNIQVGTNAVGARTVAASGTGATATIVFTGSNQSFPVGSTVTVSGMTPAGYNGTFTVTASTANSVSYANATTGAQSVAGTIVRSDTYVPQNDNNMLLEYFIGLSPTTVGAGYGSGGYGAGGYGVGVAQAPATGVPISMSDCFLDNWGSIFIACPNIAGQTDYGSPIYYYDPTQNPPSPTVIYTGPLKANGCFVAMPQRQLVAWGATFTGIQDHLLIAWSDVDDFTVWADQPQNQAGSYRLPRGSRIIAAAQGPQQSLVWTDIAIWAMQYIGQPDTYGFNEIATGCGLIAPKAWGILGGVVYWMSQSQFFMLGGEGVQIVDCPLWDLAFQQIDTSNLNKIRCAPNSRFNEISWFIPIKSSNGEVGINLKLNPKIGWDYSVAPLLRTAWTNQSVLGAPIGAGLDKYIYMHESMNGAVLLNDDTRPLSASFTTGMFALSEGDMMMYVDQWWPDMKYGLRGGTATANVQFTFTVYKYANDPSPRTYGPYSTTQATQFFCPRFRGRLVQMTVSSTDIDSFWRTGANRFRVAPDGKYS